MTDHACRYKGEALLLTEERDRAEQRIKELESHTCAVVDPLYDRIAELEAERDGAIRVLRTEENVVKRLGDRLAAAEAVVEAARKLLMDTPLGVPSAGGLSQALAAHDAADAREPALHPMDSRGQILPILNNDAADLNSAKQEGE